MKNEERILELIAAMQEAMQQITQLLTTHNRKLIEHDERLNR